jgi:hypothetical protein
MQVTTANFRPGGIGSAPLSNVAAYCSLALRTSFTTDIRMTS